MPICTPPSLFTPRGASVATLLLSGALLLGCQDAPSPVEPDALPRSIASVTTGVAPGRATRLTLTPADTVPIGPIGAAQQLLARAFNGTTEVATPVKWWVGSDGDIATLNTTLCTSPCYVTVTSKALGKTKVVIHEYVKGSTATWDTTWVKVMSTVPPTGSNPTTTPTPSQVVVDPASITLEAGQAKQFAAYGETSNGEIVPVSITWSATGGSISRGLYTAGLTAGTYRVIGSSGGMADTSSVTVTAPGPEPGPDPASPLPPPTRSGSYLGPDVASLPMSGAAWTRVKADADAAIPTPDLCDPNNKANVRALAAALVYARTGTASYKAKVVQAIERMYTTHASACKTLSIGRQLGGWVLAADYVGYRDAGFVAWLSQIRTKDTGVHSRWHVLHYTAGNSSNNWGTWALASMIAADRYLGDAAGLARDWSIFKGYGDGTWAFERTGDYMAGWTCTTYRAIEAAHCGSPDKNGAPVEDASRSGNTTTPDNGYVMEAMSAYAIQAMLLHRAGYDAWGVNNQQIKRVAEFQRRFNIFNGHNVGYFAAWILNDAYGTSYPALVGNGGRMFAYADWLYGP